MTSPRDCLSRKACSVLIPFLKLVVSCFLLSWRSSSIFLKSMSDLPYGL